MKRIDVLNYLKDKKPDIVCLQDIRWISEDLPEIKKHWDGECILHGNRTNSRGVAILFSKNFEYVIGNIEKDDLGNLIAVDIKLGSLNIKIMNIYGPNKDSPSFFNNISNIIASNEEAYVLLCGDLNIALDPLKDTYNYSHINNPNARKAVLNLMSDFSLTDVYRDLHPDTHRYTWRRKNPLKQARLDYYLASNTFLYITQIT